MPHVSCKKITLESNSADSTKTDVTLLLEIYQNKSELLNSSWLNNLAVQGTNFLDSMYIQVVHTTNYKNCKKLLPSNDPLNIDPAITSNSLKQVGNGAVGFSPSPSIPGNVYVAKTQYGDAYLPRGPVSWWEQALFMTLFAEAAFLKLGFCRPTTRLIQHLIILIFLHLFKYQTPL